MDRSPQPNTLGNASLALGIASAAFVFGIGLCALAGRQQPWLQAAGLPLFICGASSAFLGLLAAGLGLGGLFGSNRPRAAAVAGLLLGVVGLCLFFAVLNALR
ncbi:MAG: hypothetical protein L0332_23710 [Chloroflexi bacterium]|nr:hypothetical protein [Chloroflexota bacterium]